jgi:KipI family sensor histidine kinase inhibitor
VTGWRLLPYGQSAVLVELAAPADVLPARNALVAQGHPAVLAVVPAARTVLVHVDPDALPVTDLTAWIEQCLSTAPAGDAAADRPEPVELAVRYDGIDLASVARRCGLPVAEVIRRHSEADYTVQFCGFAPGFGYLSGLDPALRLPRLASPRPAVPAGSVAIAGEFTGVYPRSSPGGWLLLGRTDAVLFDLDRDPPALLRPGTPVRLRPV